MTKMKDFQSRDGLVDWDKYDEASKAAGEKCVHCGTIIIPAIGSASLCGECMILADKNEVTHSLLVRCPNCQQTSNPRESDEDQCYEEGEHELVCNECDHEFTIATRVSYEFTSPPIINNE